MRTINIIETNEDSGVCGITTFGVPDESKVQEVVERAENDFKTKALENGASETYIENDIENGFYARQDGYTVAIVWGKLE